MITTPKMLGIVAAAFLAGTFIASPELRAFAANTVFSTDIVDGQVMTADLANNAVTAAKIKDGEVKAAEIAANAVGSSEIATDAVGGAELQAVTKLLFGQCNPSSAVGFPALEGGFVVARCNISGADTDDSVIATLNGQASFCFDAGRAYVESSNVVVVWIRDLCETPDPITYGAGNSIAVIVYDK